MTNIILSYNHGSGLYEPPPDHTLTIPRQCDWISSNSRTGWRTKAKLTSQWFGTTGWHLKSAKLPALGPSRIVAELHMHSRRRSRVDPANYTDTAKPCIDAMVKIGRIWPDDSSDWVIGPDMRLGQMVPATDEALVLLIWGKPCCPDALCHHGTRK